jgi:uncharacterized protein YbaR (Trm112 family)
MMPHIIPWLLERLVCPLSKAPVVEVGDWLYSTDPATRRRYPIRDGIPNMLIDESETVEPEEFRRIVGSAGAEASEKGRRSSTGESAENEAD